MCNYMLKSHVKSGFGTFTTYVHDISSHVLIFSENKYIFSLF